MLFLFKTKSLDWKGRVLIDLRGMGESMGNFASWIDFSNGGGYARCGELWGKRLLNSGIGRIFTLSFWGVDESFLKEGRKGRKQDVWDGLLFLELLILCLWGYLGILQAFLIVLSPFRTPISV